MRTVGIDLAAEPAGTVVATLVWRDDGAAAVSHVRLRADDEAVFEAVSEAQSAAMDAPFGWPDPFVEFVTEHQSGDVSVPVGEAGLAWRRRLSRRETDLACEEATGVRPLSVSADRIAAVAMRGAGVLSVLAAQGRPVARDGSGTLIETYPAAALKAWSLPYQSYKGPNKRAALGKMVDALCETLHCCTWESQSRRFASPDDLFHAIICALVARSRPRRGEPTSGWQRGTGSP